MTIYQSINPFTEEVIATYPEHTDLELAQALEHSSAAFKLWRPLSIAERAKFVGALANVLENSRHEHAELMTLEMGKPVLQAIAEVEKCASACRYFAENADQLLQAPGQKPSHGQNLSRQSSSTLPKPGETFVRYDPLGPVLAIMPWNFPYWQVFRFCLPALIVGNTVVMKHAPNTQGCALAITEALEDVGFPPGVFQNLLLSNQQAALAIADTRIRAVTLTGSTEAGRNVAQVAGRNLKKCVLELGGNDPFIVFPDVDLKQVAILGVSARCINSGQSCIAAKRFFVHQTVFEDFKRLYIEELSRQVLGNPLDTKVTIGPLARKDLCVHLGQQVELAKQHGATVAYVHSQIPQQGFFFPPTVLEFQSTKQSLPMNEALPIDEEFFGPVAQLAPFENETQLLSLANSSRYGLGASIWTKQPERALQLIAQLENGSVFINSVVKSDPRYPFGGMKDSGYGRELGREGMLEFVNVKTISA